ncbi:MAG: c-type cytochrome, partial [Bacteroidota bacterium]
MKKIEKLLLAASIIFFIYSCGSGNQEESDYQEDSRSETTENDDTTEPEEEEGPQLSELALKGEQLFNTNCSACHMMSKEDMVGPGLLGVTK